MKNSAQARAAFWKFMWGIPDLFLTLPEDKAVDAFEARLRAFKAQWPDYPTPSLDKLLEAA